MRKPFSQSNDQRHSYSRNLTMMLSFIGVLALLTACGGATDEVVVEPETEPIALNVSTGYKDLWGEAEESVIQRFEETHLDIKVIPSAKRKWEPWCTMTPVEHQDLGWQGLVAQEVLPDLLFGEIGYDLTQVAQQEQLASLNDLWTQSDLDETFPISLQTLSVIDGHQYYLPMITSWVAIYYNTSILDRYDLAPPQTWDELLHVCDILYGQGIRPFAFGPANWSGQYWFDYLNLRLNGLEFHRQLLQGQVPFDDDRVYQVFDTWRILMDRGCFGEDATPMGIMDSRLALIHDEEGVITQEQAAMTLITSWEMKHFPEKFQTKIDFFRFPVLEPAIPIAEIVYAYGYVMPRGAEDLDQALEFLTYVSSVEAQTMLAQGLGPNATSANLDIDPKVLSSSQIKGLDLLRDADGAALAHFLAIPPAVIGQFEQALATFVNQPDNINDILLELEAKRQEAVAQGVFE